MPRRHSQIPDRVRSGRGATDWPCSALVLVAARNTSRAPRPGERCGPRSIWALDGAYVRERARAPTRSHPRARRARRHPDHHHRHGRLPRPPGAHHRRTRAPEPRRPPHNSQRLSARRGPRREQALYARSPAERGSAPVSVSGRRRGSQSADSAVAISVWGFAWAGVPTTRASTRLASKRTIRGAISRSMLMGSVPGRAIATTAIAR
jgi:hypothetical protein